MKLLHFVTVALSLGLAPFVSASEPALRGFDPVHLCEGEERAGDAALAAKHGRYTYHFASAETRARFLEEPERWGVQWGGACGRMGPLSGAGSSERWAVHDDRIYIFASDGCREGFLAAPERFVVAKPEFPNANEISRKTGAAWIKRAALAHGDAALESHSSLRLTFEGPRDGWTQRLELLIADTGALMRRSCWTPPEDAEASPIDTRWVVAQQSFVEKGGEVHAITSPDQLDDLRRFAQREPLALFWARQRADFRAVDQGPGELAGKAVRNVLVQIDELMTTLHLDPQDARILGLSWRGRANGGITRDVVEVFTEWETVNGVLLPTARECTLDGKAAPTLAVAWETVELSSDVPAHSFRRDG